MLSMSDSGPTKEDPLNDITNQSEVTTAIPTVQGTMARRPPVPVPPEFAPPRRPMAPPPLRIHPVQWQEHLDAMENLAKVVRYLVALVTVVLVILGYATLQAVNIVSAIHSLATVRASIGV